jgi:hypothetical protein
LLAQLERRCGLEIFHIFSTKFKAPSRARGALEVEFGPLPMGKPDYGWVWWDAKFDFTQFQKKYLSLNSYAKVMTILPKHVRVMVLEGKI